MSSFLFQSTRFSFASHRLPSPSPPSHANREICAAPVRYTARPAEIPPLFNFETSMTLFCWPVPLPATLKLPILGSYKEILSPSPTPSGLHHTSRAPPPLLPLSPKSPRHSCFSQSRRYHQLPLPSVGRSQRPPRMGSSHLPLTLELLAVRPGEPQCRLGRTPVRPCATIATGPR
jgi:hypothetical protein